MKNNRRNQFAAFLWALVLFLIFLALWWIAGTWVSGSLTWPVDLYGDHSTTLDFPWPILARIFNLIVVAGVGGLLFAAAISLTVKSDGRL
ncbi:MAG TPA: hypothetical protein VGM17_02480 [Rhizomicrobium sp.]|jgi:hypothetical protein